MLRHIAKDNLEKQVEVLRTKTHWKKTYFYLWDEPLNIEHYDSLLNMAKEIHAYAPDARILTTYYSGPSDAPLSPTLFEAFVKVPKFLRPHNQIYCTSEWVLSNRGDLVKSIADELQPENGEIKFRRGLPAGDGVLYYPGQVFSSSNVPVASLRLERILNGLQDIEYLKLHASRYGRAEGLVLFKKTGVHLGPERYTLEHAPIDAMRGEIYNACRS